MLGDGHSRIIAAGKHQAVEHLLQGQLFALLQINAGARYAVSVVAGGHNIA